MAQYKQWFEQDFTEKIEIRHCESVMFTGDDQGTIVGVYLYENGTPYSGGGTVSGAVKRSDGGLVAMTGALSGNAASVVIPPAALAYPGPIGVHVVLNQGGSVTTILKAIYCVDDNTGVPVDPGSIVPSYEELLSEISAMREATAAAIAATATPALNIISPKWWNDSDYAAGSYVIYNGFLYRCIEDIAAPPEGQYNSWDASKWVRVYTTGELQALNEGMASTANKSSIAYDYYDTSDYGIGSFVVYNRELYQCNTEIPSGGESWNPAHWTKVNIVGLLEAFPAQLAPVRYNWNQGLNDDQKAAARNNIGAVEPIAIAPVYDATKAYSVGEYFIYNGLLYKCIQNAPAGTSPNNYTYFDNPAISSEVAYALAVCVRHTWNQGLTADQQAAARFNISAVGYAWNQGLTADQQAAARYNIGAIGADAISPSKYDAIVPYLASRQGFETVSGLPMLILYETEDGGDWADMTKDDAITMNWRMRSVQWVQHPADSTKHAIASVDTGEVAANTCTVKWQGSSSLSYPKKNFTVKLSGNFNFSILSGNPGMDYDDTVPGDPDWGSHKKYVLKANYVDPTHARNICLCKLWGQMVHGRVDSESPLYSLPNGGAIDGFPVMLVLAPADGSEWQYIGLYTLNIPKDDWMFGMEVKENGVLKYPNAAILCAEKQGDVSGFWSQATLNPNDNTELWDVSVSGVPFEIEYNDTATAADIRDSLNAVIAQGLAVFEAGSVTQQAALDALWALIDKNSVIDHYIFACMFGANDCMLRNYLLVNYNVGTDKWFMSEYDLDSVLGILWTGTDYRPANTANPTFASYAQAHALMRIIRLYEKPALISRYQALRAGILSEDNVSTVLLDFTRRIPRGIKEIEAKLWPTTPSMETSTTDQMITWYMQRCKAMDAEISALGQ